MNRTWTRSAAAMAVATGAMLFALVAQAPAAGKLSGKTILAPNSGTLEALSAAGLTVTPADGTSANDKGLGFPITGGKLDLDSVAGKIEHSGGLTFANAHGTSLTVEDFVVKVGAKNVIRASVAGGGHVRLADLDLSKAQIAQRGSKVVISNVKLTLAKKAAGALSATFGLPDLTGAKLGKATVKATP